MASEITTSARAGDPAETTADTRVVGLIEGADCPVEPVAKLVESGELKSTFRHVGVAHAHGVRYIAVGLGKAEEFTPERARVAAAVAAGRAAEIGAKSLSWQLPEAGEAAATAAAIVEGTILKAYTFDRFKSKSEDDDESEDEGLAALEIVSAGADLSEAVATATIGTKAVNRARELQNLPSNVATPSFLADRAAEIAASNENVEFEIHDRKWIESKGMGAFAAVGKGSAEEPRLIELRYNGAGASGPTLGFVGKAVTFDTGGISLKPSAKMDEMKFDMSGAASVFGALKALATIGAPINVVGIVPTCENMPSGRATKPGDIVTSMAGKTIEVLNTDAEGRLILCDGITYARRFKPRAVVDVATLTGACVVALGAHYCGLFSPDDSLAAALAAAGDRADDRAWRMPVAEEYAELLKSNFADMANVAGREGGAITAACFLWKFTDGLSWAHLDIAGSAYLSGAHKGSTGRPVPLLVDWLLHGT